MPQWIDKAAGTASKFINGTNRHVFLTGRAGTGKTTFLRDIRRRTHKNVIVAAPTGIAAINAEGVTLHSLFNFLLARLSLREYSPKYLGKPPCLSLSSTPPRPCVAR